MSALPYDQRRQPDNWFAAQPPPPPTGAPAPINYDDPGNAANKQGKAGGIASPTPPGTFGTPSQGPTVSPALQAAYDHYPTPFSGSNPGLQAYLAQHPELQAEDARLRQAPSGGPSTGGAGTPFTGGEAEFTALFGRPGTPAELVALEDRMKAYGITIARNAAGTAGKIKLPNGQIIDVIRGAEGGGQGFWWGEGGPAAGGGAGGGMNGYDPGYADRLGYTGDLQMDPGFQFRLQQGQQAIERSAAAKGTLLTGGTLKGLERYAQDYSSNEFQNRYQRLFGEQQNRYNQLYGLASLGQNAAAQTGNAGQNFANQGGNLLTDQGNAQAAGTVGAANAKNAAIQNGINAAQQIYLARLYGQQRVPTTDPYAPGGRLFSGPYNQ